MSFCRSVFLSVLLAVGGAASAETVLLRFRPPVGTKLTYTSKTIMTMSSSKPAPGMNGPMTITTITPIELRVVSRAGTVTTMETRSGKARVFLPANSPLAPMKSQMESMSAGMVSTASIDELGNVKSMEAPRGGQSAALAKRMGSGLISELHGVSLPVKPVKVGETWSSSVDMGKAVGMVAGTSGSSQKMPMTFRLASIETRGGKRLARIEMSMKGSMNLKSGGQSVPIGMSMSGYSLFDVATGLTVETSMTSDSTFTVMGNTMKQHMVMTMALR